MKHTKGDKMIMITIDRILKMYETEIKMLDLQIEQCRSSNDMERYYELSMKFEELNKLFNKTIKIINEEAAR